MGIWKQTFKGPWKTQEEGVTKWHLLLPAPWGFLPNPCHITVCCSMIEAAQSHLVNFTQQHYGTTTLSGTYYTEQCWLFLLQSPTLDSWNPESDYKQDTTQNSSCPEPDYDAGYFLWSGHL